MNHKRHRPKHARAGCLYCKPWKDDRLGNASAGQTRQELRARLSEREQRVEAR